MLADNYSSNYIKKILKFNEYCKKVINSILNFNQYNSHVILIKFYTDSLVINTYHNQILINTITTDYNFHLKDFLQNNSDYNLSLLFCGFTMDFNIPITNELNFFDKIFFIKHLKKQFESNDCFCINKITMLQYQIISLDEQNQDLNNFIDIIKHSQNCIINIASFEIESAIRIKNSFDYKNNNNSSLVIIQIKKNEYCFVIFQQDMIIFTRQIELKNFNNLINEIDQTISYIIQNKIIKTFDADCLSIYISSTDFQNKTSKKYNIIDASSVQKNPFDKTKFSFYIKTLFQNIYTFKATTKGLKYLLFLSVAILCATCALQVKSFFQNYELSWQFQKIKKNKSKINEQVLIKLKEKDVFNFFLINFEQNKLSIIKNIENEIKKTQKLNTIEFDSKTKNIKFIFNNIQLSQQLVLEKRINSMIDRKLKNVDSDWVCKNKKCTLNIKYQ